MHAFFFSSSLFCNIPQRPEYEFNGWKVSNPCILTAILDIEMHVYNILCVQSTNFFQVYAEFGHWKCNVFCMRIWYGIKSIECMRTIIFYLREFNRKLVGNFKKFLNINTVAIFKVGCPMKSNEQPNVKL